MGQRGLVRNAQRGDQHVVMSPVRLDLVEDVAESPMDFRVDLVELIREQPAADGRDVNRLPVLAWMGIEPLPESFEDTLTHIRRHTRSFALVRRRIDPKEVTYSWHRERISGTLAPRLTGSATRNEPVASGDIPEHWTKVPLVPLT